MNNKEFIVNYLNESKNNIVEIIKQYDKLIKIKNIIKNSKKIFLCGNGGSSSTASHLANDFQKMCGIPCICLTDNTALLTAWSNDNNYDFALTNILKPLAEKGDTLIIYSGSGESDNVLNAARWALKNNINVIAFTGYDGGYLIKKDKITNFNINSDMQHSEDWHLIIGHLIMKLIMEDMNGNK